MEKPKLYTQELKDKLLLRFPKLILASQSPNRTQLLKELGIEVINKPQDILEFTDKTIPGLVVEDLAYCKLKSYIASQDFDKTIPALSADTLVLTDGKLAGKPKDREDAFNMLLSFSEKEQQILSGFALYTPNGDIKKGFDITTVRFKTLTAEIINSYLDTNEYIGAAGAYKIQKQGFYLMDSIVGSFSNAIGLPLEKLL